MFLVIKVLKEGCWLQGKNKSKYFYHIIQYGKLLSKIQTAYLLLIFFNGSNHYKVF